MSTYKVICAQKKIPYYQKSFGFFSCSVPTDKLIYSLICVQHRYPLKHLSCFLVCVCFSASVCLCLSMRTESWAICSSSVVGNISIKKLRVPNRLPISNTQTHTHAHTNTPYWPHPGEAVLPELMHYVTRLSWELLNGHTDSKIEKKSRVGQEEDTKWNRVCTQQG